MNVPQLLTYTFKDQDLLVIDLTGFIGAWLEVKREGEILETVAAVIASTTLGQVLYPNYVFTEDGTWDAQFYVIDASNNKVFGEPIQFKVVRNVENLDLTELAAY